MPVVVVPQRWWSVGRSLHDSPTLPTYGAYGRQTPCPVDVVLYIETTSAMSKMMSK